MGIDPARIAASGASAGGHLAAASSMCLTAFNDPNDDLSVSPVANALLLYNPVFDNGPGGYGFERVGNHYPDFSPLHNLRKGAPPTLLLFGDTDQFVPVATAEKYRDAMHANGDRCELRIYKNQPHGFFNPDKGDGSAFQDTLEQMDRFLVSLGYLQGEPTVAAWFQQHNPTK